MHATEGHTPAAPALHSRLSLTAVASLVTSLLLCCPVTSVAAIVLGAFGVGATRPGHARGRGLAIAGLSLGVLGLALQLGFGGWAYTRIYTPLLAGPGPALDAGAQDGPSALVSHFDAKAEGVDADQAQAFLSAIAARYGSLLECTLDRTAQPPTPSSTKPVFDADFLLRFERGTVKARSSMQITDKTGALSLKLLWVEIMDPAHGDLRFPAATDDAP